MKAGLPSCYYYHLCASYRNYGGIRISLFNFVFGVLLSGYYVAFLHRYFLSGKDG
jgi:hypothetical protein